MNSTRPDSTAASEQADVPTDTVPVVSRRPELTVFGIFANDHGLRAIWGIALFLLFREILEYCVYPVFQTLLHPSETGNGLIGPRSMFVFEGAGIICLVAATWLMAMIEHRQPSVYGFAPQRRLRNFCEGLGWGVALLSMLVAILRAMGLLVFDSRLLAGARIVRCGSVWGIGFLLVALAEELFLRGYLQFTLTRGLNEIYRGIFGPTHANALGFWTAAVALSFAFGFRHRTNPGESPLGLVSAGLAGLVFCLSLWRTGSLWWAIGFHSSWDWAQSFLYGVADSGLMVKGHLFATHPVGQPYLSGGITGPEGSIFLLPVLLAAAAAILLTLPRTHLGYRPRESHQASLH